MMQFHSLQLAFLAKRHFRLASLYGSKLDDKENALEVVRQITHYFGSVLFNLLNLSLPIQKDR